MNDTSDLKQHRAELLAQMFLQDLGAAVWTAHGEIGPFDSIAVFETDEKKMRLIAIEVKSTEEPVGDEYRFKATPKLLRSLRHSNVPVLFLIVDVKRNEVFYGWASGIRTVEPVGNQRSAVTCLLPVSSAANSKRELLHVISSQPDVTEVAAASRS